MGTLRLIALSFLLLTVMFAKAQRVQVVEGHAVILMEEAMTPADAKHKVVEEARKKAITDAFGTNIAQNIVTRMDDDKGESFSLVGESDLRGIWLRDVNKPRYKTFHSEDGQSIYWEAWVKGEVREVTRAKVEFEWKLLANGTDDRCQTDYLHDGDTFYVKFRSPVNGYLLLFLVDGQGVTACALPEEGLDYCKVESNRWYTFIYDEHNLYDHWTATLPANKDEEINQLYVVFSPNKLAPPVRMNQADNSDLGRYSHLRHVPELSFESFHKYLGKVLSADKEVQQEKKIVKITRR